MILKGNQRGGGRALAAHLLNMRDNDHVELHSIDGLIAEDVTGAFLEIEAVSRATKCKQPFFSLSLSPPKGELVMPEDFRNAIDQAAEKLGLAGQPHVIIFHEKETRRHCHVVWSRIDLEEIKAVNLPFYKERLNELARELYLSHGWELPKGLSDQSLSNPLNFGLTEWQEAKRAKRDPREIKAALKQCWSQSDGDASFASALKERGFWLARGDQRGFVILDYQDNVYSLSRWLDIKSKNLRARLGEPEKLPSVDDMKKEITALIGSAGKRLIEEMAKKQAEAAKPLLDQRQRLVTRQREERKELVAQEAQARAEQACDHAQRFRRGLKGLFDWITGRRAQIFRAIEAEKQAIRLQAEAEFSALRKRHLEERAKLQIRIEDQRSYAMRERQGLANLIFSNPILSPSQIQVSDTGRGTLRKTQIEQDYNHN